MLAILWCDRFTSSGAYGAVHLGRHKETKESVAIKILKKKQMIDKNCAAQVFAEKEVLKFAQNPFVVQVTRPSPTSFRTTCLPLTMLRLPLTSHLPLQVRDHPVFSWLAVIRSM